MEPMELRCRWKLPQNSRVRGMTAYNFQNRVHPGNDSAQNKTEHHPTDDLAPLFAHPAFYAITERIRPARLKRVAVHICAFCQVLHHERGSVERLLRLDEDGEAARVTCGGLRRRAGDGLRLGRDGKAMTWRARSGKRSEPGQARTAGGTLRAGPKHARTVPLRRFGIA